MGLINWIFDIYQHSRIESARDELAAARAEIHSLRARGGGIDEARLERVVGELALATKAVQRVLVDKGVCTHEELAGTIDRIDAEDGRLDGQSPV